MRFSNNYKFYWLRRLLWAQLSVPDIFQGAHAGVFLEGKEEVAFGGEAGLISQCFYSDLLQSVIFPEFFFNIIYSEDIDEVGKAFPVMVVK